jgi:hypothetical protein
LASTRVFSTGATRNDDTERIDPEGFLSPKVMAQFFEYMHKNRFRPSGEMRASDNWQLGITQQAYAKSISRHYWEFFDKHREQGNHKDEPSPYRNEKLLELCCAEMFNFMGYMFEELKKPLRDEPPTVTIQLTQEEVDWKNLKNLLEEPIVHFDPSSIYPAMNKMRDIRQGKTLDEVLNLEARERTQSLQDRDLGDETDNPYDWGV